MASLQFPDCGSVPSPPPPPRARRQTSALKKAVEGGEGRREKSEMHRNKKREKDLTGMRGAERIERLTRNGGEKAGK